MSQVDLLNTTACDLSRAIHTRTLSCRELMEATLERVAQVNPRVNAIVSLREPKTLLAEADVHDQMLRVGKSKGWLHGIPQAVKDLSACAGLPLTMGSPLLVGNMPKLDGLMAQRMRSNGAIFIGKTNVPEFGLGSHSYNTVFGVTRNPHNLAKSAGGSSGGAAAALATRMLAVADGSDFMGSLRNPAAWCGVYGMRPSQGRVPMWPAAEAWVSQLGTEGPMARNVADLRNLLQVQAGFDARAPLSIANAWHPPVHAVSKIIAKNPINTVTNGQNHLKIGYLGSLAGHLSIEPGIEALCEAALARFSLLGHAVESVSLPMPAPQVWQAWLVWRKALVAARIAPFLQDGANRAHIKAEALWEHDEGAGLSMAEFMQASAVRTQFQAGMAALLSEFDAICLPSAQVWPFDADLDWPASINGRAMDTYHRWMECTIYATFAGLPAISVPVGFGSGIGSGSANSKGLPMGMQLIGKPQGDWALLDVAESYEAISNV